jgi:hypothetical protein
VKKFLLAIALVVVSVNIHAEPDADVKRFNDAITNAKMAGMCGAFKQMADFQNSTQMPGGDDFIKRFGATEAARMGFSIKELTALCAQAIENYNDMNRLSLQ